MIKLKRLTPIFIIKSITSFFIILLLCNTLWGGAAVSGSSAPEFELKDLNGHIWKLSDLRGKVVFLNFWSTWCPTCKDEMPSKETVYKMMQGRPFQMLGVLFRDAPENLNNYNKKKKISTPTLIDPDSEVAGEYGIVFIPVTFIIDKKGVLREKIIGSREWDSPEMLKLIEKWL